MRLIRKPQPDIWILILIFVSITPARPAFSQESNVFLTGEVLVMLEEFVPYESAVLALTSAGFEQPEQSSLSGIVAAGMPEDIREDLAYINLSQRRNRTVNSESNDVLLRVSRLLSDLNALDIVKHAEADFIEFITPMQIPTDEYYHSSTRFPLGQWSLQSSEPYSINADIAWDKARGAGKIIAILDNGFTLAHQDLQNVAFFYDEVDHPEAPSQELVNKFYLVVFGPQHPDYRVRVEPTGDWQGPDLDWENEKYHGIACSGVAAAQMDNAGFGIVGVAPEAEVGMIRMTASYVGIRQTGTEALDEWEDDYPTPTYYAGVCYSDIVEAVYRAVPVLTNPNQCARVINMSWGLEGNKPVLEKYPYESLLNEAINHARSLHCLVVAATGNDGAPEVRSPARYDSVMAVGATTRDGRVPSFSNYSEGDIDRVDCVAPGDSILVTMNLAPSPVDQVAQRFGAYQHLNQQNPDWITINGEFRYDFGTSFATAIVSGAAAVLQSWLIESEASVIQYLLTSTTRPTLTPLKDGKGLIDLAAALDAATIKNVATELTTLPVGSEHIDLTWDAHTIYEFDRYEIWRSIDGGELSYLDAVESSTTMYTDQLVFPGFGYTYEIRARSFPFGGPGRCPPGFPEWVNISYCGRSDTSMVNLQTSGGDDFTDRGGEHTGAADQIPTQLTLDPNYPNPFNPSTTIKFGLPASVQVRLVIMNIRGEIVRTVIEREMSAGWHSVVWNGSNEQGEAVASGIYLYLIDIGKQRIIRKMTLIR